MFGGIASACTVSVSSKTPPIGFLGWCSRQTLIVDLLSSDDKA
jgi:hypothetical protein